MTKVATTMRCVPRYGYEFTEVRNITLDLPRGSEDFEIHEALVRWFNEKGIEEAVFAVEVDDDGFFAVINDEAFEEDWGQSVGL